eukprot:g20539.t1
MTSLDWRLVVSIVEALGIKDTKLWQVLDATHRSATHSFGDGSFVLEHGCKEGDPSSPLLFIMAFTVVMKRLKQRLEAKRAAEGENEPDGVPLYVREEVWHLAREDKLCQLIMSEKPGRTVQHVLDFLFADDTTLVQRATAEQLKQVKEHDEQAKKEERRLLDLPIMQEFGATLTECGLRENESKRVQADVVEITTRNLGMNVNPQADCDEKIRKAWKAVTWRAMVGKFVPPGISDVGWLRSEANVLELAPADREMPDMLGDRIAHLANECGLPIEMLRLLFETVEQANARRPDLKPGDLYATNKNIFYAATRKWFVREVARDWARGDAGRCKWCGVVYGSAEQEEIWCEPTEIATVPQLLKQHLHDCHKAFEPDEAEAHCRKEFVKLAKECDAQRSKWIRGQIIGRPKVVKVPWKVCKKATAKSKKKVQKKEK